LIGDGLTILQANTIEDAGALMQAEPLILRGLRQFGSAAMGTPRNAV